MNKNFYEFIRTQLNDAQKKAVLHEQGPLLIVAGAGSGKTRIITARIAHLIINCRAAFSEVVALTFTNRAANEMKKRVEQFIGSESILPFIGTFHSFCLSLLKKNSHLVATPFISVLDEDDKIKLISTLLKKQGLEKRITAKQISYQVSHIKNHALSKSAALELAYQNQTLHSLYQAYEHEKHQNKCFDFDDLLLEGVKLFAHPEYKSSFQKTVRHILVDEYQDTNVVQHALLKHMSLDNNLFALNSLAVVGDEDQSIYSWRGATIANIAHFAQDFSNTSLITIEQNYRTVQPILDVANALITHNNLRNPKQLWSEHAAKNCIYVTAHLSEYQEAEIIALLLQTADYRQANRSTAILYRAHFQSHALEEAFIKHSIPYQIIGGITFYERREIKDILGYLKLIVNPFDRTSFLRVINCPMRGLGDKVQDELVNLWNAQPFLNFQELIQKSIDAGLFNGQKRQTLTNFLHLFDSLYPNSSTYDALTHLLDATGYITYLQTTNNDPEEASSRVENVKELINAVVHLQETGISTVEQFLDEVALMQEHITKKQTERNPVLLMTLHAAKGLEFDTVIIVGLEEGVLPSGRSTESPEKLEEERRLLYVGITRAEKRLVLSRARYRYTYGQMADQLPSRFLKEIPEHLYHSFCEFPAHTAGQMLTLAHWFKETQHAVMTQHPIISVIPAHAQQKKSSTADIKEKKIQKWKLNQPVNHPLFGIGLIQKIETRASSTHLTIKFKTTTKKIDAQFVKAL